MHADEHLTWTVGDVAKLTGVSVRMLHHYDEIGLLQPRRAASGYRRYDAADLERLRRILYYRELDFGLDEIRELLDRPGRESDDHVRRQHKLLHERIGRAEQLLAALQKEMEARRMGMSLTPEEQFEVFGTDRVGGEWADEAEQRWGDTEAFRESARRTARYSKDDWIALKAEADEGLRAFAAAMSDGAPVDGTRAMDLAETHRQYLTRWFYDCSHELHRGLAQLYLADERFSATFDSVAPGLAAYVAASITANAERHSA
jgi:MerR family transcriptional regulator, thiopeptide resistance regulator